MADSFTLPTSSAQTSASNPEWYQAGLQNILRGAENIYDANMNFTPYGGGVVAPTNVYQGGAQSGIQNYANYTANPALVGGLNAMQAGANQLNNAGANFGNLYSQFGGSMVPYTTQLNNISSALNGMPASATSAMTPYQTQFSNLGALAQMNSQFNPSSTGLGQFMNPYTQNVVNQVADLGNRNLTENILPGVQSQFSGAGQFGSRRMMDFQNRAIRDTSKNILDTQGQLLNTGYNQAMQNYGNWADRGLGGLSQAGNFLSQGAGLGQFGLNYGLQAQQARAGVIGQMGGLAQYGLNNQLQTAQQQANLGTTLGQFGLSQDQQRLGGLQALNTIGNEQWNRDQMQNQFDISQYNAQQQYPFQSYGWLSNIVRGLQPGQVGGINFQGGGGSVPGTPNYLSTLSNVAGGLAAAGSR